MNKYIKQICFLWFVIVASSILLTACSNNENSGIDGQAASQTVSAETIETDTISDADSVLSALEKLEICLPSGMERYAVSDSQELIKKNDITVGGVFLFECGESIFSDILNYSDSLMPLVLQALENVGITDTTWYMGESSVYGLMEYNLGTEESEYIAYLFRGSTENYIIWFNRKQIPYDTEVEIMQSVHSDDIVAELNNISSEAHMAAIAEQIDSGEYYFEVELPAGMTQESTATDGVVFYKDSQLVGGYKVVHFEKGILPAVQENKDLILERLKTYMNDQIDMSDCDGKITNEALITAVFTDGSNEYTHYIFSYGQVGTQYVVWVDTSILDEDTANSIKWGAHLASD